MRGNNQVFLQLLDYIEVKTLNTDIEYDLKELAFWEENNNGRVWDFIDYERLLYLEFKYQNDERMLRRILDLKRDIVHNYMQKEKLKARYTIKL